MPGIDERLTRELHRLGEAGEGRWDAQQTFERVAARKARRRTARRLEAASLVTVVLVATVAGSYGLWKILGVGRSTRPHPATSAGSSINGRIAFVRSRSVDNARSVAAVYTMNPDGGGLARLTGDDEAIADLAWSPDGTRLAFAATQASAVPENGEMQIYVMNADGSNLTQLTQDPSSQNIGPVWSPDGTRIAYAKWANDVDRSGLYVIGADRNGEKRLTNGPIDTSPTWFPGGSKILFVRSPEGISELHVVNADGTGEHAVAEPRGGYIGSVALSPDGMRMAFTRLEPDLGQKNFEIFVANADGAGEIRLTHTLAPEAEPSWAPDGTRIVFAREGDIYTMALDGSDVRRVTNSGSDGWPTWQGVPASSESPAPVASPSPSASVVSQDCLERQSIAVGDFDGDGTTDKASVSPSFCVQQRTPIGTPWALSVTYANGGGGWAMPDCSRDACRALGAGDLNGDGVDELAVLVDQGASSQFVEFFEILVTDGPGAIPVSPGAEGLGLLVRGRFEFGGTVTHYAALGCDGAHIISEVAVLNAEQTEWAVHRTVLTFEPGVRLIHSFVVVSTDDSTQSFDPDVSVGDIFEPGAPCWTELAEG